MRSEDDDGIAYANEVFNSRGVPVGQADAAVAGGATDGFGIVGAVDANTGLVDPYPKETYQIVRPRGKVVVIVSPNTVVQHPFIVTEPWPDGCPQYFPRAHGCRKRLGPGCDREHADQLVIIEYLE